MSKDNSEPAFPRPLTHVDLNTDGVTVFHQNGMSIRDYFAGQALQGFLADGSQRLIADEFENSEAGKHITDTEALRKIANHEIARGVYLLADAMLAERAK